MDFHYNSITNLPMTWAKEGTFSWREMGLQLRSTSRDGPNLPQRPRKNNDVVSLIATLSIWGELIMSRYVAESITTDAGRFGHKGLRGRNVLHQLLLILLCICSWCVRPICKTKLVQILPTSLTLPTDNSESTTSLQSRPESYCEGDLDHY